MENHSLGQTLKRYGTIYYFLIDFFNAFAKKTELSKKSTKS